MTDKFMAALRRRMRTWSVALLVMAAPIVGRADVITFDFNSLSASSNNTAVRNYVNSVWSANGQSGLISVTGAHGERTYTGDNFVVGPVNGNTVTSLTLGNTDGNIPHLGFFDSYIVTGTHSAGADRITMVFPTPIYEVSFDYEIFPNGDGRTPDFSFIADGNTIFLTIAAAVQATDQYPHSPMSGPNSIERNPQFLGLSGNWFFPQGVTRLEFVDWPEMVGIDNLTVNTSRVPEPTTLVVFGCFCGGLILGRRARRTRPA